MNKNINGYKRTLIFPEEYEYIYMHVCMYSSSIHVQCYTLH